MLKDNRGLIVLNYINQIGCSTPEYKLVENPTVERRTTRKCGAMDDPIRNDSLKSSGFVKQEVNNEQINLFKF